MTPQPITENPGNDNIAQLSYEQARDELITIVKQLESGDLALADSVKLWKRGEALAGHCERWLQQTQHELSAAQQAVPGIEE